MKNNDLLEDLKAFRAPICEVLNAKIPYTDELADYLTDKGYRKQSEGEWVEDVHEWDFPPYDYTDYKCSLCGNREQNRSPFCPECGAKMKG